MGGKRRAINRPQRIVRPDAAANARKSPKIRVVHGGKSTALLKGEFDLRTKIGREHKTRLAVMKAHMGDDLTAPLERIADQAVRLSLLEDIAWAELSRASSIVNSKGDGLNPAFDAVLRAAREHRNVLEIIGLQRKAKQVPTLAEYLASRESTEGGDDGQA